MISQNHPKANLNSSSHVINKSNQNINNASNQKINNSDYDFEQYHVDDEFWYQTKKKSNR